MSSKRGIWGLSVDWNDMSDSDSESEGQEQIQ